MTETEEEIIDVGMESSKEADHLVPSSPAPSSSLTHSPLGGNPLVLSPQSPFQAYSARLRSEADYERYDEFIIIYYFFLNSISEVIFRLICCYAQFLVTKFQDLFFPL